MSLPKTVAPRIASWMDRLPVPQPASHTVWPAYASPASASASSQPSTLSTVCAWPVLMSSCTLFTSSVSP